MRNAILFLQITVQAHIDPAYFDPVLIDTLIDVAFINS